LRLERARLDTLALLRAIDQAFLPLDNLPQAEIQRLYELDADCAEALWALDQPPRSIDFKAMVRDTLASLNCLPAARDAVRTALPSRPRVLTIELSIRTSLDPREAYNDIPTHYPQSR